jgi:hypothetical protein
VQSIFSEAVGRTNLREALENEDKRFTVFAPSNAALKNALEKTRLQCVNEARPGTALADDLLASLDLKEFTSGFGKNFTPLKILCILLGQWISFTHAQFMNCMAVANVSVSFQWLKSLRKRSDMVFLKCSCGGISAPGCRALRQACAPFCWQLSAAG